MNIDDDVEEEEEYEEIEEEIEVEEHYEEIEEEEEEEEQPSDSPDVSKNMESKGHEEHLISDPLCPEVGSTGKSKSSIVSETKVEADVYVDGGKSQKLGNRQAAHDIEFVSDKKDHVASVERETQNDIDANNAKAFVYNGCVTAETSAVNDKEVSTSTKDRFPEEVKNDVDVEADTKKVGKQTREDITEELTSSVLPQTRPRSLSPITELTDKNKRPAAVCNFFAKGWCIKGNSCKFLHVKDQVSITSQIPEGDEGKTMLQSDIGLRNSTERSEAIGFPMATISSVSLESSQSQELGKRQQLNESHNNMPHQQEGPSRGISADSPSPRAYKDSSRSSSSFREFGRDNQKLNPVEDNSINRNRQFPGIYSTLSVSTTTSGALPSFSSSRARFLVDSFGKDPLHAIGTTSLLRSTSPFSGSESKNHSLKDFSMDPLPVGSHRTKISFDNWEPSVPFRPSFPYTKNLLSPLTLYDPIRDSIEQPKTADRFPKVLLRPEVTITHAHQSTDTGTVLLKTNQPEYGSDKHSISGDHKLNLSDKDYHSRYSLAADGENAGIYNERNSGSNSPMEEKPSRDVLSKDKPEKKKGIRDSLPRQQKDGITLKKELEISRDRLKNELNHDVRRDGEQKESKAVKHFRVALIDFIKELVKPTWLEGRLSKDAHKMVVKKAVEKVLSTVQPHQTPSSEESIQQYLSISGPKMAKLVEAYVVKYGKS